MAEAMVQDGKYGFVWTGLFCHQEDKQAIEVGQEFREMLGDNALFRVLTYREYIEEALQLPLEWEQRETIMKLWARYCAVELSNNAFGE